MGQPAVAGDGDEPPGQPAVVDVPGEVGVEAGQTLGVQPDLGGIDLLLQDPAESQPGGVRAPPVADHPSVGRSETDRPTLGRR